jgi:radical SAM protein
MICEQRSLETGRRPSEHGRSAPAARDFRRSPLLAFYEVTQACDLVCQHCRACAQTRPNAGELTTEQSLALVSQLAEFPTPPLLVLTGGDPLKRADIYQLIRHGVSLGLDVSITPSATPLVTPHAIAKLRDAGIARMAISIDGADAATHDATRGVSGSFDRSLEILAEAKHQGISLQVNTTLTPGNVDQIDRMAAMLDRHGIAMWSVFFLVPVGRAGSMDRLTAEQSEDAFAALWHQSQIRQFVIKTTEAPHYRRFLVQHRPRKAERVGINDTSRFLSHGVNDGKGVMFISHAGVVHPSGFLPIVCGVFPLQNVVSIYQESSVFRGLRDADRLLGKCGACEFRHLCGGSRARAYAVTGDVFAAEPDCVYQPSAWSSTQA